MISSTLLVSPVVSAKQITLEGVEKYSGGSADSELKMGKELADLFLGVQQKRADKRLRRGTHSKGICVSASLKMVNKGSISDDESGKSEIIKSSELLNRSEDASYIDGSYTNVIARFANAASKVASDHEQDLRAVSLKIMDSEDQTLQDMTMNNTTTFVFEDLSDFIYVTKTVGEKGIFSALSDERAGPLIKRASRDFSLVKSYTGEAFWSGVPYVLKSNSAKSQSLEGVVQYGMSPGCDNNVKLGQRSEGNLIKKGSPINNLTSKIFRANNPFRDHDYLQNQLKKTIAKTKGSEPVCMSIFVQFLDQTEQYKKASEENKESVATLLVENPTVEWKNAPKHKIAELRLNEVIEDDQRCNGHGTVVMPGSDKNIGFKGVGWANRVRGMSEDGTYLKRRDLEPISK